jgi:hypothetical protein
VVAIVGMRTEVVKQVINFTPEALKRPPELRSNN